MRIAVVSSTVLPACLPDDPHHTSFYGSEMYNAVLVKGLADAGHEIGFYAPVSSSTFKDNPLIKYHPITNSKGAHLQSELLEDISFDGSKTDDLAEYDFVLDMSKQNHVTEEISLYNGYNKFINFKSGYQDWHTPMRVQPHFVTHCEYFQDNFYKNGKGKPDIARFGLSDFWCPPKDYEDDTTMRVFPLLLDKDLKYDYFLFPHRPVPDKGIDTVLKLARAFPSETFVISTAAVFEDHIREMARIKAEAAGQTNVKFIDCPKNKRYHYYRRALVRNARALLSLFPYPSPYLDTGGLVSFEAIRCGTPVIVTRSPGSEEMLGELENQGVVMVDGFDGARLAIKHKEWETRPKVDNSWMPIKTYVDDYERIMEKYAD